MQLCKCGCGQIVKKLYRQGHSTKRGIGGDLKSRLLKSMEINPLTGCWEWTKARLITGYGAIRIKNVESGEKRMRAHRVSYEIFKGQIPQGMLVCHKCDNPKCINPDHLFLGTDKDNYRDSKKKGRNAKGEKNGKAILSEDQARFVKYESQGMSLKEIGEQFGVHRATISNIRCGYSWAWL